MADAQKRFTTDEVLAYFESDQLQNENQSDLEDCFDDYQGVIGRDSDSDSDTRNEEQLKDLSGVETEETQQLTINRKRPASSSSKSTSTSALIHAGFIKFDCAEY